MSASCRAAPKSSGDPATAWSSGKSIGSGDSRGLQIRWRAPGVLGRFDSCLFRQQMLPEMIAGPIAESVDILAELRKGGTPIYGLTNWSAETCPGPEAFRCSLLVSR